jgi:hypothetical protein
VSAPDWKLQTQFNTSLVKTTSSIGTFVEDVDGRARVNVFDNTITARYATRYKPRRGEGVVLTFHGNTVRVTGPLASRSKLGTVTVVGHPYLTITCDGKTYTRMPYTVSYENAGPKVGDTVSIDWDAGYVVDKVTATPDDGDATPKLTTAQHPFTLTLFAKQSGSYNTSKNKWVTRDLYCDSDHQAAWFYGTTIRHSLKNDAYISSIEIYLSLRTRDKKHVRPKLGKHSDSAEKSGGVSSSDAFTVPHVSGWVHLPVAWAEGWRANVGGVTISDGNSIYRGIGTDRQSGKIRIRGRQ